MADASRTPIGSPSMTAAAMTPMIGTESVPMAAVAAGNRRKAANQLRYSRCAGKLRWNRSPFDWLDEVESA